MPRRHGWPWKGDLCPQDQHVLSAPTEEQCSEGAGDVMPSPAVPNFTLAQRQGKDHGAAEKVRQRGTRSTHRSGGHEQRREDGRTAELLVGLILHLSLSKMFILCQLSENNTGLSAEGGQLTQGRKPLSLPEEIQRNQPCSLRTTHRLLAHATSHTCRVLSAH